MDKQKRKTIALAERIEKFVTNSSKTGKEKRNETFLNARLQLLKNYWNQYNHQHEAFSDLATDDIVETDEYFKADRYSQVECSYIDAIAWLTSELEPFQKKRTSSHSGSGILNATLIPPTVNTKLPTINLPTFGGSYLEWPSFRDTFKALIHDNEVLSDVQKMHYLKSAMTKDAVKLIQHLSMTNANYDAAWRIIVNRFDNNRLLVNTNLQHLVCLPAMTSESGAELRRVLDTFNQSVQELEKLSRPVTNWDDWLVYFLASKLDTHTRRDWETSLDSSTEVPTFSSLSSFLESRLHALNVIKEHTTNNARSTSLSSTRNRQLRNQSSVRSHHTSTGTYYKSCVLCKGSHHLSYCQLFRTKTVDERLDITKRHRLCANCLRSNHNTNDCPSKNRCCRCNQLHHTMLHKGSASNSNPPTSSNPPVTSIESSEVTNQPLAGPSNRTSFQARPSTSTVTYTSTVTEPKLSVLLATAMVIIQSPTGRTLKVRALLDQGSESCFITSKLANLLDLPKESANISVHGIAGCEAGKARAIVSHFIRSVVDDSWCYPVKSFVMPTLTGLLPSQFIPQQHWSHVEGLHLADPNFNAPAPIDLILGVEIYATILRTGVRLGPTGSPVAQETILGWVLSGSACNPSPPKLFTTVFHSQSTDLSDYLRKFWETEEPPSRKHLTPEEGECEEFFQRTHYRNAEGRYVVKLPFKRPESLLGSSYNAAISALLNLERRFSRNKELYEAYREFISEYLKLGHMELVPPDQEHNQPAYYLPHHAVVKLSSTTTKLRVVFNASQNTTSGVSLNDLLHVGPKLQNEIFSILIHWRFFPYVYTADIEKMFRQIIIDGNHTDFQRILWRFSPEEQIRSYRLLTVTYGTSSAPYLACRALRQLTEDHKVDYPEAAEILKNCFYVDDALFGAFNEQSARSLRNDLRNLLLKAGFNLRKWLSNSENLIRDIPEADRENVHIPKLLSDAEIKTLGIGWDPSSDTFCFQFNLPETQTLTKRTVLSDISRVYDPLGWLSPVVITGKIYLQKLWLTKLDWDTELPSEMFEIWCNFKRDIQHLKGIKLPRWLGITSPGQNIELHGFCDASLAAYSAVVYIRVKQDHSKAQVSLLSSKSRVCPIKTESIPRLELRGASLLSELVDTIQKSFCIDNIPIHLWCDSTIVLTWLRDHPAKWKVFVANRVALIHEVVPNAFWHHVSTHDNPADLATRGISASDLINSKLWWHGPEWLSQSPNSWPQTTTLTNDLRAKKEIRRIHLATTNCDSKHDDLLLRYSTLNKLLRITSCCIRFSLNCKSKSKRITGPLTNEELDNALRTWIKIVQGMHFSKELACLKTKNRLPSNSSLLKLNPFIDIHHILRVGGRLTNSLLEYDEKHPVILPGASYLSQLIIDQSHKNTLHGGVQATLHHIRIKFWLLNGRNKVRHFIRNCVVCCRYKATTATQLMGDLPADRVRPAKPFSISGVDFAGPFLIKPVKGRSKQTIKAYAAIFICFSTRAIHLELVMDLTSEAFIAALQRFTSRRGRCSKLYSDNGRNFVGADKQLDLHLQSLVKDASPSNLVSHEGIEWHFIPPRSPHFGGLWEAGVKTLKYHLRRIVGPHTLTIEEMTTLLSKIEACLNSRPLHPMSDDPNNLSVLTPGHFLVGENLLALPIPSTREIPLNRLSRWQMVERMNEHLWRRWQSEYLHHLQIRNKWQHQQDSIKINTLVLLKDENLPPSRWALGRVVELHPGKDGCIRVVTVKHQNGLTKRAITKICILPLSTES